MPELLIDSSGKQLHRRRIEKLLSESDGQIRIASPYITETDLLSRLPPGKSRILTSTNPDDLANGSSSLSALGEILRLNIPCCYYDDGFLHAKVYIFGEKSAIVSSANFTKSALDNNLEIGVQLDGAEVAELIRWFDGLWNPDQLLTIQELERIRPQVEAEELAKAAVPESQIEGWRFEKPASNEQPELHDSVASEYPNCPELLIPATSQLISLLNGGRTGWICNTKREPPNYPLPIKLEELMRRRSLAATWQDGKTYYQMIEVEGDDLILMHGNKGGSALPGIKNGIIGVGIAEDKSFLSLEGFDPDRLSLAELEGQAPSELEQLQEWRVSIKKWLFWDPLNPLEIDGTPSSFHRLSDKRRSDIIRLLRARLDEQK